MRLRPARRIPIGKIFKHSLNEKWTGSRLVPAPEDYIFTEERLMYFLIFLSPIQTVL